MAHREFTDSNWVTWNAWDVYPSLGDRRRPCGDRRVFIREAGDRRTLRTGAGVAVSPEYARGWLSFQSGDERRRLVPVPAGWEELDASELERLCQAARPVGRCRRVVE
jgi:hypothetical protein